MRNWFRRAFTHPDATRPGGYTGRHRKSQAVERELYAMIRGYDGR